MRSVLNQNQSAPINLFLGFLALKDESFFDVPDSAFEVREPPPPVRAPVVCERIMGPCASIRDREVNFSEGMLTGCGGASDLGPDLAACVCERQDNDYVVLQHGCTGQ